MKIYFIFNFIVFDDDNNNINNISKKKKKLNINDFQSIFIKIILFSMLLKTFKKFFSKEFFQKKNNKFSLFIKNIEK